MEALGNLSISWAPISGGGGGGGRGGGGGLAFRIQKTSVC